MSLTRAFFLVFELQDSFSTGIACHQGRDFRCVASCTAGTRQRRFAILPRVGSWFFCLDSIFAGPSPSGQWSKCQIYTITSAGGCWGELTCLSPRFFGANCFRLQKRFLGGFPNCSPRVKVAWSVGISHPYHPGFLVRLHVLSTASL